MRHVWWSPEKISMTLKFRDSVSPSFCWLFTSVSFQLTTPILCSFSARCALAQFQQARDRSFSEDQCCSPVLAMLGFQPRYWQLLLLLLLGQSHGLRNTKNQCKIKCEIWVKHLHLHHYIHIGQMPMACSIFSRSCAPFSCWNLHVVILLKRKISYSILNMFKLCRIGIVRSINQHLQKCITLMPNTHILGTNWTEQNVESHPFMVDWLGGDPKEKERLLEWDPH